MRQQQIQVIAGLCSCSDMIDGSLHMAYGFSSFMFGLFKLILMILLVIAALGFVVYIIKSIFGK